MSRRINFDRSKSGSRSPHATIQTYAQARGSMPVTPSLTPSASIVPPSNTANTNTVNTVTTTLNAESAGDETYLIGRHIIENKAFEWGFGRNIDGELSLGVSKKNALVPACVSGLKEISTRQIASSSNSTICITQHGALYFSGSNLHGKVGKNSSTQRTSKF